MAIRKLTIREKIEKISGIENSILVRRFGTNIHDLDLRDSLEDGVVNKLIGARKMKIPYAVVIRGIASSKMKNPLREVITTYDIETENEDYEQEEKNIYAFLKGDKDSLVTKNEFEPLLSRVGKKR